MQPPPPPPPPPPSLLLPLPPAVACVAPAKPLPPASAPAGPAAPSTGLVALVGSVPVAPTALLVPPLAAAAVREQRDAAADHDRPGGQHEHAARSGAATTGLPAAAAAPRAGDIDRRIIRQRQRGRGEQIDRAAAVAADPATATGTVARTTGLTAATRVEHRGLHRDRRCMTRGRSGCCRRCRRRQRAPGSCRRRHHRRRSHRPSASAGTPRRPRARSPAGSWSARSSPRTHRSHPRARDRIGRDDHEWARPARGDRGRDRHVDPGDDARRGLTALDPAHRLLRQRTSPTTC